MELLIIIYEFQKEGCIFDLIKKVENCSMLKEKKFDFENKLLQIPLITTFVKHD